jgi:GT2 family glycosyltransferase
VESLGSIYSRSGDFRVVGRNHRERRPSSAPEYLGWVTSVLGAAFVARRSVFEALGGFDESMFMYFEETDLCWRGWLRGARSACWFDPARPTRVYHTVHGTHPKGFDVARYFERNRTLSMFRNLEGRSLPWMVPQVGRVVSELARTPRRLARYGAEVAVRLPDSAARRRGLQATRTVRDADIFALRPPADLGAWFAPPGAPSTEANPK